MAKAAFKHPTHYGVFTYKGQDTNIYQHTLNVVESLIELGMEDAAVKYLTKAHYNMSEKAAKKLVAIFMEGMF